MRYLLNFALLLLCMKHCESIEAECFIDGARVICRCLRIFGPENEVIEDLSDVISRFLIIDQFTFAAPAIRAIDVIECGSIRLEVNFRTFVIDNRIQNISDINFESIEDLHLDIRDIDYGNKQIVFKGVRYLTLSGELNNWQTRVDFYIHGNRENKNEVLFRDFLARSYIHLINIQDARSVTVKDSAFLNLGDVDLYRVDMCYSGYVNIELVDCEKDDLFITTVGYYGYRIFHHPIFIIVMVLLLLILILVIVGCLYYRNRKKKKELEFIGYPVSTISTTTNNPNKVVPVSATNLEKNRDNNPRFLLPQARLSQGNAPDPINRRAAQDFRTQRY